MNPVDALAAVGRVIGDGMTLAAEILCPRDHTAEDRLRSWESASVAVDDEICDEADELKGEPTAWVDHDLPPMPRNYEDVPVHVHASAADTAADPSPATTTGCSRAGDEGPEGASAIPPAAPSGQPTSELLWDLTQAVIHLSQFGPSSVAEFKQKYNPLLERAFDRFDALQAAESDPGAVTSPAPGDGRPTSQLLMDASQLLAADTREAFALITELRERADIFRAIED